MRITALLIVSAAILAPGGMARPPSRRRRATPPTQLEELAVTGERTGPGMWRVHRGRCAAVDSRQHLTAAQGHHLALQAGRAGAHRTQRVLVPKPLEIGIVRILWLLVPSAT